MSGIAGIAKAHQEEKVRKMLNRIAHRGPAGQAVKSFKEATLGVTWKRNQEHWTLEDLEEGCVADEGGGGRFARSEVREGRLSLKRDPLGAAPLYLGEMEDGMLCFASEVKALLPVTRKIREFPPGHQQFAEDQPTPYFQLQVLKTTEDSPEVAAEKLRTLLSAAVERCLNAENTGAWLSGGLDSSTVAALVRPLVPSLHTFSVGIEGAPDLEYAKAVAGYIHSEHHELILKEEDLIRILPEVIGALESFDALLVRSSLVNYLVGRLASEHIETVFSGEAGDELFAGYLYLKDLPPSILPLELLDITGRLHNTAFQRVDRCASAHGTLPRLPFADPDVVDYAFRLPIKFKLRDGVEKWILRRAMAGLLPDNVLNRTKVKFWEGAGVGELLARHAEDKISDADFKREMFLPDGTKLSSKEELLYYRFFREHFKGLDNLSWMGRTKGGGH
ncbi:MAG: asparagine synthase-related protein [bacterium]